MNGAPVVVVVVEEREVEAVDDGDEDVVEVAVADGDEEMVVVERQSGKEAAVEVGDAVEPEMEKGGDVGRRVVGKRGRS